MLLKFYQCSLSNMVLEINWIKFLPNMSSVFLKPSCNLCCFYSEMPILLLTHSKYEKNIKCFLAKFELQMIYFYCWYFGFLFKSTCRFFRLNSAHQSSLFLLDLDATISLMSSSWMHVDMTSSRQMLPLHIYFCILILQLQII